MANNKKETGTQPEEKKQKDNLNSDKAEYARRNDIITLTDENGKGTDFEFLDLIDYSSKKYAVLVPADEKEDQVVIFEVEDADTEDNTFTPVKDPDLAMAIFNLFKDRNKEFYDFS